MSKRERQPELRAGADLIPESVVRAIGDERRAESELTLVTSRLAAVPTQSRDPGAKVDDYVDSLARRRADLLERVQPASPSSDFRARRVDSLVSVLGPVLHAVEDGEPPVLRRRHRRDAGDQGDEREPADRELVGAGRGRILGQPEQRRDGEPVGREMVAAQLDLLVCVSACTGHREALLPLHRPDETGRSSPRPPSPAW